ncbi:MAG: hypothetical protein IAE62_07300 [Flavobacteriales bacterium]|nr:hypothetical protein [Flavobacteriales bacterium]HCN12706.1 hypothetical protein [Chryseobacterium sp.]HQD45141.1 hypothetical protein [Kaistella sp.]
MGRFLFIFFYGSLLMMSSCQPQSVNAVSSGTSVSFPSLENKIVYLFFEIEKTAGGLEKVILTDTKVSSGSFKNASLENKENIPVNLRISMIGKSGEVLEERIIEDPLNPVLEVYAEEGLSKNQLQLNKAEFSVRFNQKGNIASVKVEKITKNSKNNLITVKL